MKKKKLSISHIHWGFPPIVGGVETHLTILLPMLARMGHKINLLTGSFEGHRSRGRFKGAGIWREPIMDLNWLAKRGINGLIEEIKDVFRKFIDHTRPDCIHAHNMHYFSKPHARVLEGISQKKGIPIILTAHNVWDDNLFLDLTKNIKWAHIIAVSHFIKREIIGTGYPHRKITVIHHGIDQNKYLPHANVRPALKKYPVLRGKKVIFHPARMSLAKGCDVSIKAMRIIKRRFPDAVLVLAGTKNIIDWDFTQQKDIAYMVNLIKSLKIRENMLIDMFPLDLMPSLYAASTVCVYPSSASEPFGLTMLEALSSARPMIITEAGGMPEIIKEGITGFIVPVKDFESLASRVIDILSNRDVRERMGITGRRMIEQLYTKEIVAQNTLRLYKELC